MTSFSNLGTLRCLLQKQMPSSLSILTSPPECPSWWQPVLPQKQMLISWSGNTQLAALLRINPGSRPYPRAVLSPHHAAPAMGLCLASLWQWAAQQLCSWKERRWSSHGNFHVLPPVTAAFPSMHTCSVIFFKLIENRPVLCVLFSLQCSMSSSFFNKFYVAQVCC